MDQQNKVFLPQVLPVLQGSTVEFHNSDTLQHNVFGIGDDEFDLGNWNAGVVREHTFNAEFALTKSADRVPKTAKIIPEQWATYAE